MLSVVHPCCVNTQRFFSAVATAGSAAGRRVPARKLTGTSYQWCTWDGSAAAAGDAAELIRVLQQEAAGEAAAAIATVAAARARRAAREARAARGAARARPATLIVYLVMQHCNAGSLLGAIRQGAFWDDAEWAPRLVFKHDTTSPSKDIYALGILIYMMCLGHGPFEDQTTAQMVLCKLGSGSCEGAQRARHMLALPWDYAAPLQTLVWECTRYEKDERPTAAQCVERLQEMLASRRLEAPAGGRPPPPPPPPEPAPRPAPRAAAKTWPLPLRPGAAQRGA
eukprot:scaffold17.g570.t1